MILFKVVWLPFKLGLGTGKLATKATYRTSRAIGLRRLVLLGTGVAVGLAIAPMPGAELRSILRRRMEARGVTDGDLLERVRFELAHHPRTWHLPQPDVTVFERRVTLRGDVPDEDARAEMLRAAGALPGVSAVDDRLQVTGTAAAV